MPKPVRTLLGNAVGVTVWVGLLLAGCGPPEPEVSQEAPPESVVVARAEGDAPEDDPRPALVAFGDSLTAGKGVSPAESYPGFLQAEFDRRGLEFQVVNEGISGDTTARALSRIDGALRHSPEWVILAIGANDGLRGLPLDAMEANLERMVRRFTDGGAQVVVAGMMLPRNYGPEYVGEFEAVYPRVAAKFELPLIPFLLENVAMVRELNQFDGIHPNAKGNEIVARQVADFFEGIVRDER
ncbi:MAG: arylesterase [Bryobacterales bacterium]|nr:arylesterase [Bryobacterales bacterium]